MPSGAVGRFPAARFHRRAGTRGGSAERAGQAVYCHPNMCASRPRRLQELTGRSLSDPWAVAELAAALQAVVLRRQGPARKP
jgi:PucR C-terminal helix-turn-helix domain